MPYITQQERREKRSLRFDPIESNNGQTAISLESVGETVGDVIRSGADLQYVLAVAIQVYLENKGLRYAHCEDIMGALTGAIGEFQRCVVDPYEAQKANENGGVYNLADMNQKDY